MDAVIADRRVELMAVPLSVGGAGDPEGSAVEAIPGRDSPASRVVEPSFMARDARASWTPAALESRQRLRYNSPPHKLFEAA